MLNFIIGEKGSGKTEYCIKNAVESSKGAIIIVPEQFSHRAEAMLVKKLGVFGLGNVEVLSFGQMAKRILALSENAACRHIDNAGKVMVLYKIISESDAFSLLKGNEEEKAVCVMRLISEFKRYDVAPDDIFAAAEKSDDKMLKTKLAEIGEAYNKFEENISGKFINADDNLARLASSEYAKEKYKDFDIFIDSFTSFTQAEIKCIEMFLKCAKSVAITLEMDFEKRNEIRFFSCNNTFEKLTECAKKSGITVNAPVFLKNRKIATGELSYLSENYFVPSAKPYDKEGDSIRFFTGKNLISEIEFAASQIRALVMNNGYLYRDFAVICSDLPTYSEYVKSIFDKYDIKVFPDVKTNVANHPVAAFVKGALDIIVKGFTYSNIFRTVKYGFFDILDKECDELENFTLESGARGGVWAFDEKWEEFVLNFYGEELPPANISNIISAGKKVIRPLKKFREELAASTLVKEKCRAVYMFLTNLGIPEKLSKTAENFEKNGDVYTAIEYKSVYNKIIDVLDEMCEAIGDERVSSKKFADVLNVGISQFEIGKIPALSDGVACAGIESVKDLSAKVIFVLGMNEGMFPVSVNKTGLLNDYDRQRLSEIGVIMAADAEGKAREGEYLLYKLFAAPEDKIYLCNSASSIDGGALREAWALQKIKALFPMVEKSDDMIEKSTDISLAAPKIAFENLILNMAKNEKQNASYSTAYRWFSENEQWNGRLLKAENGFSYRNTTVSMSEEVLSKLYGEEMTTAVTRLEKFSACPFSYYMRYVLGAKPRKIYRFEAKDAGVFLHSIAEEFSKRLENNGKTWKEADEKYIKCEVEEILSSDMGLKKLVQVSGGRGQRFFARLCSVAEYALGIIAKHIQRGKFQPMGYEIKFSEKGKISPVTITMPDGRKVKLTGVIDRMDLLESEEGVYFRIIDYKTGSREFDLGEVYHGITLQLAVYMCAAANMGAKPAGMLYFKFANPDIHDEPFLNDDTVENIKMKKISLSGLLVSSEHVLNSMDIEEKFDFLPIKKRKDGTFSGSIATEENFEDLRKYVTKTVAKIANEIFKGKTDISPYKLKDASPCDYCDFGDACNFDSSLGCRYRMMQKVDRDEIWEDIKS